jgi:hypothetical protein
MVNAERDQRVGLWRAEAARMSEIEPESLVQCVERGHAKENQLGTVRSVADGHAEVCWHGATASAGAAGGEGEETSSVKLAALQEQFVTVRIAIRPEFEGCRRRCGGGCRRRCWCDPARSDPGAAAAGGARGEGVTCQDGGGGRRCPGWQKVICGRERGRTGCAGKPWWRSR